MAGVGAQNSTLVMPPFESGAQLTEVKVHSTNETAFVRAHVERVIQRVKIHIVTQRVSHHLIPHLDNIMHILCVLTNLRPGINSNWDIAIGGSVWHYEKKNILQCKLEAAVGRGTAHGLVDHILL